MPYAGDRRLIELRSLHETSNEETAVALGMNIDSYYPKHKLPKAHLHAALRKEGII